MDHERARSLFVEYHDDALAEEQRRDLEEHLRSCPDCRREWETYKQIVTGVSSLVRVKPSEDFVRKIEHKIGRRSGGRFFGVKNEFSLTFAVVSFVLIVFFLIAYLFIASGGAVRVIESIEEKNAGTGDTGGDAGLVEDESPPRAGPPGEDRTEFR